MEWSPPRELAKGCCLGYLFRAAVAAEFGACRRAYGPLRSASLTGISIARRGRVARTVSVDERLTYNRRTALPGDATGPPQRNYYAQSKRTNLMVESANQEPTTAAQSSKSLTPEQLIIAGAVVAPLGVATSVLDQPSLGGWLVVGGVAIGVLGLHRLGRSGDA